MGVGAECCACVMHVCHACCVICRVVLWWLYCCVVERVVSSVSESLLCRLWVHAFAVFNYHDRGSSENDRFRPPGAHPEGRAKIKSIGANPS